MAVLQVKELVTWSGGAGGWEEPHFDLCEPADSTAAPNTDGSARLTFLCPGCGVSAHDIFSEFCLR